MEERCSGFPVERKRSAESPRVWTSVFEYVAIHQRGRNSEEASMCYRRALAIGPEGDLGLGQWASQWYGWSMRLGATLHVSATSDQITRATRHNCVICACMRAPGHKGKQ